MDVSINIEGFGSQIGFKLYLEPLVHQMTAMAQVSTLLQMCLIRAQDDASQKESVCYLEHYLREVDEIQMRAMMASSPEEPRIPLLEAGERKAPEAPAPRGGDRSTHGCGSNGGNEDNEDNAQETTLTSRRSRLAPRRPPGGSRGADDNAPMQFFNSFAEGDADRRPGHDAELMRPSPSTPQVDGDQRAGMLLSDADTPSYPRSSADAPGPSAAPARAPGSSSGGEGSAQPSSCGNQVVNAPQAPKKPKPGAGRMQSFLSRMRTYKQPASASSACGGRGDLSQAPR